MLFTIHHSPFRCSSPYIAAFLSHSLIPRLSRYLRQSVIIFRLGRSALYIPSVAIRSGGASLPPHHTFVDSCRISRRQPTSLLIRLHLYVARAVFIVVVIALSHSSTRFRASSFTLHLHRHCIESSTCSYSYQRKIASQPKFRPPYLLSAVSTTSRIYHSCKYDIITANRELCCIINSIYQRVKLHA